MSVSLMKKDTAPHTELLRTEPELSRMGALSASVPSNKGGPRNDCEGVALCVRLGVTLGVCVPVPDGVCVPLGVRDPLGEPV